MKKLFRIDYESLTNRVAYVKAEDEEQAKERFHNGDIETDYEDNGVEINVIDVYEG